MKQNRETYNNNWINASGGAKDQKKPDIDQVSYESKDHNKNEFLRNDPDPYRDDNSNNY